MPGANAIVGKQIWRQAVAPYEQPRLRSSLWQLANTVIPMFVLIYVMYRSLTISYWLTLALAIPAALFSVRVFGLFHDCTHRSLFRPPTANSVIGSFLGFLTLTPYFHWRTSHWRHHASASNLDRRSSADVWTLTVQEYLALPPIRRLTYRCFRSPLTLLVIGPILKQAIWNRFSSERGRRERWSVYGTNLALLGVLLAAHLTIGLKAFLLVVLPPAILASSIGGWLTYVQHTFEDTYWERAGQWDYATAALHGSSFYRLPKVLQWFTASLGYHHVHHLSPQIPNYRLQQCHEENALFRSAPELTALASLRCLNYRLWDEDGKQVVGWDYIKIYKAKQAGQITGTA